VLRLEHRQLFRSNGLIDDFVLHGDAGDYLHFAARVEAALGSGVPVTVETASSIQIEILEAADAPELFTSLQNQEDFYGSLADWSARDILRVRGRSDVLEALRVFLVDLSRRGRGYSYISEYSVDLGYSTSSPEWRMHVQDAWSRPDRNVRPYPEKA
jgi:hypothetical protein